MAAAILFAALAGCSSSDEDAAKAEAAPKTFDVTGQIYVHAISNGESGSECRPDEASPEWPARPASRRSGVEVGGKVAVLDAAGEVIGLGEVGGGTYTKGIGGVASWCHVPFFVDDVPDEGDFFGIRVGDLPAEQFSRDELDAEVLIDLS